MAAQAGPANLRVILHDVSKQGWLGGTEYMHNLVRALRGLPPDEQPELTLLQSAWSDPARHAAIAPLIETVQAYPAEAEAWWAQVRRRLRQASRGRRYMTYARVIRERRAEVIFPMVQPPEQTLPIPWIGWAWDFQHRYLPEFFPPAEIARRDAVFAQLAAHAPLIVVSSEAARADFDRFFPGAQDRLRTLHFATVPLTEWYTMDAHAICAKFDLPMRFLALPNSFWAHKNHRAAFEAIRMLVAEDLDICLVCTGTTHDARRPGYFAELEHYIQTHGLARHIRVLGVLPRGEQVQLLRAAAAIVQPSLFEGWSTVVEDARALGKRIFLSDIPVHREQNPPGAHFFDPHSATDLANALRAEWPRLRPGPIQNEETVAQGRQAELVSQFARCFVSIAREGALLGLDKTGTP